MGLPAIPPVFQTKREYITTQKFWLQIVLNPDQYAHCKIVSLTRVKDLNSDYAHEYIQFVVEDEITKARNRIYVERLNDIDLDQLLCGPPETQDSKYKMRNEKTKKWQIDLPLPLTSVMFDDADKRPSILDLASIFVCATIVGGPYVMRGHSCYWFASQVYDVVRAVHGGREKLWNYSYLGGTGNATLRDLRGYLMPWVLYKILAPHARNFKRGRENGNPKDSMIFAVDERSEVTDLDIADNIQKVFSEEEAMSRYISDMAEQEFKLSAEDIETAIGSFKEAAQAEADGANSLRNSSKEIELETYFLVRSVSKVPGAKSLAEKWEQKTGRVPSEMSNRTKDQEFYQAIATLGQQISQFVKRIKNEDLFKQKLIKQLQLNPRFGSQTGDKQHLKTFGVSQDRANDSVNAMHMGYNGGEPLFSTQALNQGEPLFEALSSNGSGSKDIPVEAQQPLFEALAARDSYLMDDEQEGEFQQSLHNDPLFEALSLRISQVKPDQAEEILAGTAV